LRPSPELRSYLAMRALIRLVVLCGCLLSVPALDVVPEALQAKLPDEAKEAVDKLQKETDAAVREAQDDIADERADLIKDLEKEQERAQRRGGLEAATAIAAHLAQLRLEGGGGSTDLLAPDAPPVEAPVLVAGELPPLPSSSARKAAGYVKAQQKAASNAARDIYQGRDKAVRDLERQVASLTRAGDLAEAQAVQAVGEHLVELVLPADFLGQMIMMPGAGAVVQGNVALAERGATVEAQGTGPSMIDGVSVGYTGSTGFAQGSWPCAFTVTLDKVYAIRQIRMLLWDGNQRHYRYKMEVSPDGEHWAMLADRSEGEWRSWQTLDLAQSAPVKQIRVTGLFNSDNGGFHIVELEAYCVPPKQAVAPKYASTPP
jgi:hypothetical protein